MIEIWAVLAIALAALYLCTYSDYARRQRKSGAGTPPTVANGLFGWKGLVKDLSVFTKDLGPAGWADQFHNYGRTHFYPVFPSRVLATTDPANIKAILASQFKDFSLGMRKEALCPSLGHGIFTLDGSSWSHSRALLRPQFTREQISRVDSLEAHFKIFVKCIDTNHGKPFDIQRLFFALTMDTATDFLMGESVGCLEAMSDGVYKDPATSKDPAVNFQTAFDRVQRLGALRVILQELHWIVGGILFRKEFRATNRTIQSFVEGYVDKALLARKEKSEVYENPDKYVFLYELARETTNPTALRDQVLNILIAGRDTTASTLSWILFHLARQPEIFQKLRVAVLESFGTSNESISFESLKQCDYLRHVINEGLRLYPVVPINMRVAVRDTTLPKGAGKNGEDPIFVAKGTMIHYAIYWTHRDEAYWGKDSEDFRPERWDPSSNGPLGKGWEFLPFNGGPRICLGQQFALTEMGYILARLVQTYSHIGTNDHKFPPRVRHAITMCHGDGVFVTLAKDSVKTEY